MSAFKIESLEKEQGREVYRQDAMRGYYDSIVVLPDIISTVHLNFPLKPILLDELVHLTLCGVIDPSGTEVVDTGTTLLGCKESVFPPTRSMASITAQENPAA
jgi:hypothetical protein